MNLRRMTNTCCKLILILMALFVLHACSKVGGGDSGQSDQSTASNDITTLDKDGRDRDRDADRRCRRDCDDDDRDDDHRPGPGPGPGDAGGGVNFIAVHNPNSSQYDENCLNCHGDIPDGQSLDSIIPNAHVAMLAFTPGEKSDQCIWCHRDVSNTLIHTAAQVGAFQHNIRKTVDTQLCAICHGPVGPGKQFYRSGLTTSGDPDGAELYNHLCAACHKELANSEVKGESVAEIYKVIAENEGGMGPLSVLRPQWIQAIALALGGDTTLPTDIPASGTGASLYQQYCSNCHGALASSAKAGTTASQIQQAITSDTGGMAQFGFLTAQQIQDIADALSGGGTGGGGTGGGTDGASLYQTNCSSCHGSLSNSSQAGASVNQIQQAIANDTGGMGVLNSLTSTQIQAIADALSGGGGTGGGGTSGTDGASLYQTNCSSCHRDLGNSQVSGKSARSIRNAIADDKGGMSSLGFLTNEQIDAIAAVL